MNETAKKILFGMLRACGGALRRTTHNVPRREDVRSILVASVHGLGDVLYASAMFPELARYYPNAEIDVWVHSRAREVLSHNPHVRTQYVFDGIVTRRDIERYSFNWPARSAFSRSLAENSYDLVIDCTWVAGATRILRKARARYLAGGSQHGLDFLYDATVPYQRISETPLAELYGMLLRETGVVPDAPRLLPPIYYSSETSDKSALAFLTDHGVGTRFVCVHLSASWHAKEWSVARYAELCRVLGQSDVTAVVIGSGPRDRELLAALKSTGVVVADAVGKSIDACAGLLRAAICHIGADSFPSHLAAAVGTPVILLAGPTNPTIARPPGNQVHVLYHELPCSAHGMHRNCTRDAGRTCPYVECLDRIVPRDVIYIVRECVASRQSTS